MGLRFDVIGRSLRLARWLVLPVCLLLFLQWPLRDGLAKGSREANDLGQVLFAVYVSFSVIAATRHRTHLATDVVASRWPDRVRRVLIVLGNVLGLVPWALLLLIAGSPIALNSLGVFERFPDTGNPFYFVIKGCVILIGIAVLWQALADVVAALTPARRR
jgi:TRAP-type mannitol/chloroaromatic compound transport system permease small subunit